MSGGQNPVDMEIPGESLIREIVRHPSVGAIALGGLVFGAIGGWLWASATFARADTVSLLETKLDGKLTAAKNEIVDEVQSGNLERDLRTAEKSLSRLTRQIALDICATEACKWEKSEKEVLEQEVQSIREQLK